MESTGVPGRIQVTPQVVELVPEEDFVFERRGVSIAPRFSLLIRPSYQANSRKHFLLLQMVQVKGKGEMETYFLEARQGDSTKYYRTE